MCQTPLRQRGACRTVLVPTELPDTEAAHMIDAREGTPKAEGDITVARDGLWQSDI